MRSRRSPRSPSALAGSLLLAHPALRDPNFRHSVILLSTHEASGAMGVARR
jgi:putative transcriptional regulator